MFDLILVKPMLNALALFYSIFPVHDFGISIILLTLLIRAILWPLQSQTLRNQKALNKIQPEVKKIQEKYKNDPQKVQAMTLELYKEKEVNPLSSCLPSLIQLPLLFALFYALVKFRDPNFVILGDPNTGLLSWIYPWLRDMGFVKEALSGTFRTSFIGLVDLAKPSIVLAVIAGAVQFVQTKMMTPKKTDGQAAQTMNMMLYMFPALTIFVGATTPGALPLYWIVTSGAAALQQYLVMHHDVEELDEEAVIEVKEDEKKQKTKSQKPKK